MSSKRLVPVLLSALVAASAVTPAAQAENSSRMCLFSRDVKSVKVIDRDHLLFTMRNGAVWENTLWKTCYRVRPGMYLDWGQDNWHDALCTWPQSGPPFPMKDSRNPPDVHPHYSVSLRNGLGHCRLGDFTPYKEKTAAR